MNKLNKYLQRRDNCRLCSSTNLHMIYQYPHCPPVDNYRFLNEQELNYPAFPMDLYQCLECGHAQLLDIVSPNILFGNYIYTSSSSPDLDNHFNAYTQKILKTIDISSDDLIIDIGSNDGLFLSKFKKRGYQVLGIDASEYASNQAIINNDVPTITSFFNSNIAQKIKNTRGQAKLITANNVFSHTDDLFGFANAVKLLLKDDGIFVFEVSYLLDLVEKGVVDYVYHEHLAHHSVKPLDQFFKLLGMKLLDVERVATKGGSIRCFVGHQMSNWTKSPSIDELISNEFNAGLYDRTTYIQLKSKIDILSQQTYTYLNDKHQQGLSIAAYGASATSTVINYIFDINKFFEFIVDDNVLRHGRLSPGYQIPVVSKAQLLANMPDIVFISAWRFADLIISSNQDYLERGGTFIVPMPHFKVITKVK